MRVAEEILVLIKCSPKRKHILGYIKEQVEFESEPEEKQMILQNSHKLDGRSVQPACK